MHTSILLVALAGFAPVAEAVAPSWQKDYATAYQRSVSEKKPLAVFLGSGSRGWEKLSRTGSLSKEAKQVLTDRYVCLLIDTATREGKELAAQFEIAGGLGIVISDRTGKHQAFRHAGDLADGDLVRYLQRYSDPQRTFTRTESNPDEPVRYEAPISYYAPAPVVSPVVPVYQGGYRPMGSAFTGGRCRS